MIDEIQYSFVLNDFIFCGVKYESLIVIVIGAKLVKIA
jgi:hypothetical protein